MPQLDFATYSSQLFWLGFFFILLLIVSIRFMLPRIAFIHEKRWEKIEGTREQALLLQHQAHEVQSVFEQHLENVRKQAQEKIIKASKEIILSQEKMKFDIDGRLKNKFQSHEEKIFVQRDVFMDQVQSMVQSLATDITYKILKETVPSTLIEQSVHNVITKKISSN